MTALGASLYAGFFGLAALWLYVTAPRGDGGQGSDPETGPGGDQDQVQDRSNASSVDTPSSGSIPMLVTQSSQK